MVILLPKKQRQRSPETQYSQSKINPVPLDIQPSPHYHAPNVEVCTSNVDTFINYIKQKYSVRVVERDGKWSLSPTVEYINLACIDRRCVKKSAEYEEVTKTMVQDGNVDTIIGKKRSIQFNEIAAEIYLPSEAMEAKTHPEPVGDKRLILVEGAPGAGKSTFAWEFCRRWERREIAQLYNLVILLRLRDKGTKNAKGLEQLIRHPLEGVSAAVCHKLVDSHTFHALIILEGYDELPDSLRNDSSSIFNEIISGELLPLATILVTSRPWATMDIRKKYERRIYQHLEVLGFAKRQITQYIKKTVPKDKVSGLNSYLERHPQIRSCMYIPLNSSIVVAVYEASTNDQKPMPNTLTELYISVMKIIIKRHLIGHPDLCGDGERNLSSIDMSVPLKVEENSYHLCKLAYDGILNEKDEMTLVFSEFELPPNFHNLGFMDSVTELYVTVDTSTSHNFLHPTFQEFFAAVHISGMSPEKQVEYFKSGSGGKGGRLKVVLKFLAGLNKLDCISGEIVSHFFETPVSSKDSKYEIFPTITVNIDIVNWMFETQSDNTISLILHKKNIIEFQFNNEEMLLMDYYSLGYCVSHSQCQWLLSLTGKRMLSKERITLFAKGAADVGKEKIVGLKYASCSNTKLQLLFDEWINVLHLRQLAFKLDMKCDVSWPECPVLKVLIVDYYLHIGNLHIPLSLQSLTIDCISLQKQESDSIAKYLSESKCLKELTLKFCSDKLKMEPIARALATNHSLPLERLELSYDRSQVKKSAYILLITFILNSTSLKQLSIKPSRVTPIKLEQLIQAVKQKPETEKTVIEDIGASPYYRLNHMVKKLKVKNCEIFQFSTHFPRFQTQFKPDDETRAIVYY